MGSKRWESLCDHSASDRPHLMILPITYYILIRLYYISCYQNSPHHSIDCRLQEILVCFAVVARPPRKSWRWTMRDGAPDLRRFCVPIFVTLTILIKSGAPGFSSGAHFLQGGLAQGHTFKKNENDQNQGLRFSRAYSGIHFKGWQVISYWHVDCLSFSINNISKHWLKQIS